MMGTVAGKDLEDWKVTFAQSGIKYDTDEEYQEAIYNLVNYFDALIQMDQQQKTSEMGSDLLAKELLLKH